MKTCLCDLKVNLCTPGPYWLLWLTLLFILNSSCCELGSPRIVFLGSFGVAPPWLCSYGSALVSEVITAVILSGCFLLAPPPLTSFSLLSFILPPGRQVPGHSHFPGMETGFYIILRDSFAEGPSVANCQEGMGFLTLRSLVKSCWSQPASDWLIFTRASNSIKLQYAGRTT